MLVRMGQFWVYSTLSGFSKSEEKKKLVSVAAYVIKLVL
jgi:hypothetical protein